jgi:hypothetical protein
MLHDDVLIDVENIYATLGWLSSKLFKVLEVRLSMWRWRIGTKTLFMRTSLEVHENNMLLIIWCTCIGEVFCMATYVTFNEGWPHPLSPLKMVPVLGHRIRVCGHRYWPNLRTLHWSVKSPYEIKGREFILHLKVEPPILNHNPIGNL